ncbi:hypothetical protein [Pseudemcibacter aquimaris]|uniref:hypothetical protein n=1 Tax=Pseudemcibacter aquimaris TaxID=2857064 RepID=UPI002012A7C9|nr:hypothetical protein [Pseudemcibacter aquimaris]MCC3859675.1 hypothetical protein [Pseudemcibacter aquimaris]WDU60070.1 hypothetical protein KW060_07340 [Pseudemcibacter aquimaris]
MDLDVIHKILEIEESENIAIYGVVIALLGLFWSIFEHKIARKEDRAKQEAFEQNLISAIGQELKINAQSFYAAYLSPDIILRNAKETMHVPTKISSDLIYQSNASQIPVFNSKVSSSLIHAYAKMRVEEGVALDQLNKYISAEGKDIKKKEDEAKNTFIHSSICAAVACAEALEELYLCNNEDVEPQIQVILDLSKELSIGKFYGIENY